MPPRPSKLRFIWTVDPVTSQNQLEVYIARNGRFYGFVAIRRCKTKHVAWYLSMLIPGGMDHDTNPVPSLREAKLKARKIVEDVIGDLQGVTLLP